MADFGSVTFSGDDMEYTFESTINLRQAYSAGDASQLIGISITDPSTGTESVNWTATHGSGEISIPFYAGVRPSVDEPETWGWYNGIITVNLSYRSEGLPGVTYYDYISDLIIRAYPLYVYAYSGSTTYTINVYYGKIQGQYITINPSLTQHITFTVSNPQWINNTFSLNFYPNGGTPTSSKNKIVDTILTRTNYIRNPYSLSITFGTESYTRDGYQLIGWDTNASATTPTYLVGSQYAFPPNSIGVNGNPPGNLYAIWQKVLSYVRINNTWKDIDKVYAVVGGVNKEVDKVYVALNGQWTQLM